jgi:Zn-dependent peptidase ImmA (M78 family)
MARLAQVLELPQAYFLRAPLQRDAAPHLYRSRLAATKRARESAEAKHAWLREIATTLEESVELPEVAVPELDLPTDPAALTDDQIELAAASVRASWKLGDGPVPNVTVLLEKMGCVVSAFAFGARELSAFSQRSADRPYVVLNADETAAARWRFNVGHELGHLVLHRGVTSADAARSETYKLIEKQAHRFASAFLFPERAFAEEVYSLSLDSLISVKSKWRVSMQMMLRRARDLGLVSQDRYERALREISRRGFRTQEPLDDELPLELPRLLARSVEMLVDEKVVTKEGLLHELPFLPVDIEVLTGLTRGYLTSSSWGDVAELRVRNSGASSEARSGSAKVIQFPPSRGKNP